MAGSHNRKTSEIRRLFLKYKLSKLRWKFKQIFLLFLGGAIVYRAGMKLYTQGRDLYLLYGVVGTGLIPLWYGLKGVWAMLTGGILKKALIKSGAKVEAVIYKIEYIESWSTYQKGSFIFAKPVGGLLEGMGIIFKSERFGFKIPPVALRTGDRITVYVDKGNTSNYWMDFKDALRRVLE